MAICLWSGYFFGGLEWVKKNFELVVVAIIFISVLPMIVEFFLAWRQRMVLAQNHADHSNSNDQGTGNLSAASIVSTIRLRQA